MDIQKFRQVFLGAVADHSVPDSDLSYASGFQTAMKAEGRMHPKVEVLSSRRGLGFRITVEVPAWAQRHLAEFVDAEIQAEQDRAERLAAARRLQP